MTGKGTIFVNGSATISSPIVYGNSSSRVAIIATGSITFSSSAAGANNGYFYGNSLSLPAAGITLTKGALVFNNLSTLTSPITATNDTAVWLDSTEGQKHRLPGFYP